MHLNRSGCEFEEESDGGGKCGNHRKNRSIERRNEPLIMTPSTHRHGASSPKSASIHKGRWNKSVGNMTREQIQAIRRYLTIENEHTDEESI